MSAETIIRSLETLFPCGEEGRTAFAATGERFVSIDCSGVRDVGVEARVLALDEKAAWALLELQLAKYAAQFGPGHVLYWRHKPEVGKSTLHRVDDLINPGSTYKQDVWFAYCRLLISDKPALAGAA